MTDDITRLARGAAADRDEDPVARMFAQAYLDALADLAAARTAAAELAPRVGVAAAAHGGCRMTEFRVGDRVRVAVVPPGPDPVGVVYGVHPLPWGLFYWVQFDPPYVGGRSCGLVPAGVVFPGTKETPCAPPTC